MPNLLEVGDAVVDYRAARARVRAVDGVSLSVRSGEILGIIGESGCGKSSLARAMVGLEPLASGAIAYAGHPVWFGRRRRPPGLRALQMVFQDPNASLNPRRRVGRQIADGISAPRAARSSEVSRLLGIVGLPGDFAGRYPHELSGGQRQRVALARALAAKPDFIVADEPISGLDASAQEIIATLFRTLATDYGIGIVFITHDLAVLRRLADRIAVMYLGEVVELGPAAEVTSDPAHPYSKALLGAVPDITGRGRLPLVLAGEVPDPANPPGGCRFHPRCPAAIEACSTTHFQLLPTTDGRQVRCVHRGVEG